MARAKTKAADAATTDYRYGVRTWGADGSSYGGFIWDLTPGSRTTAPDWKASKGCGSGLHANANGMGDWTLLGDLSEVVTGNRVLGVVRYDAAQAIDLDGKDKAPWMEIVVTTKTADLASVLAAISLHRNEHIQGEVARLKTQKTTKATTGYGSAAATTGDGSAAATTGYGSAAATTGDGSAAATTGYGSAAATTGDRSAAATTGNRSAAATTGYGSAAATTGDGSAAATTGDGSAAATTGKDSIAAALGIGSTAKAGEGGAIMLAHYEQRPDWTWELKAVFAGMVGQTYGDVTIEAGRGYQLTADGLRAVSE